MILYFQINYNLSSGNISHLFRSARKQKQKNISVFELQFIIFDKKS